MYDFSSFNMAEAVKCGRDIRELGAKAETMEDVAEEVVRFFYDNFIDAATGEKSCVLVRFFKTHDFNKLHGNLQTFATNMMEDTTTPYSFKCFTLLGTHGLDEKWLSRRDSSGHQAIPLPSDHVVEQIPMMCNLIKQMGLEINSVINPDPEVVMDLSRKTFNVFHILDAEDSPYVPAQDQFVKRYGVKTVLGCGGVLPSGNVFVVIIFSKTPIDKKTASYFATLALNIKMIVMPFEDNVFGPEQTINASV